MAAIRTVARGGVTAMPSPITVTFKDDKPVVTVNVDGPMTLDEARSFGRELLRATYEAQMIARSLERPPAEGSTVGEVEAS